MKMFKLCLDLKRACGQGAARAAYAGSLESSRIGLSLSKGRFDILQEIQIG